MCACVRVCCMAEAAAARNHSTVCKSKCGQCHAYSIKKGLKTSPYLITERRVPELIPVFGSQPADDMSHKPGGRLLIHSARPAVTLATLKRAATNVAAWWTEAQWVWTVCPRLLPDTSRLRFEPGPFCAWVQHPNHSAIHGEIMWNSVKVLTSVIYVKEAVCIHVN